MAQRFLLDARGRTRIDEFSFSPGGFCSYRALPISDRAAQRELDRAAVVCADQGEGEMIRLSLWLQPAETV
jgi:hypothetical protein